MITGTSDRLRRRRPAHRRSAARQGPSLRSHPPRGRQSQAAQPRHHTYRRRSRRVAQPRSAARSTIRGAAFRAAAGGRSRRSPDHAPDRRVDKGADYTAALRLHKHQRRVRRLRRRARDRGAAAEGADAASASPHRSREPIAAMGRALWRAPVDPARARHLRRDAPAPRPTQAGDAGPARRGRCVHQPHPRRRPGAGCRRRGLSWPAQPRLQHHRRCRTQDGRLVRYASRTRSTCRGRRASPGTRRKRALHR